LLRRSSLVVTINGGTVKVSHGTGEGRVHSSENVVVKLVRFEPRPQQIGLLSCFGKLFQKRICLYNSLDLSLDLLAPESVVKKVLLISWFSKYKRLYTLNMCK